MRPGPLPSAALLLLAVVAGAARPAAALDGEEAAPPLPPVATLPEEVDHPALVSGGERLVEFRGEMEAGARSVWDRGGRYGQDLNLDDGLRLFRFEMEGTALEEGLLFDRLSLRVHGVGDPDRSVRLRATGRDRYDLLLHSDRQEYVYRATFDPHPFDTVREREGARLRLDLAERLDLTLATERLTRTGDALLLQRFNRDASPFSQVLPVAAPVDYDRREHTVGIRAAPGAFRVGVTQSWSDASDDALRLLRRPETPPPDRGVFRTDSAVDGASTTGHAGVRLLGGRLDLSVAGGYRTAETDSRIRGEETVVTDEGPDGDRGTPDDTVTVAESRGDSGVVLRDRFLRGEALWLPHGDWEVRAGGEKREARENGFLDLRQRFTAGPPPAPPPAGSFFPLEDAVETEADQQRAWIDGSWRASAQWRLRAGAERVRERVRVASDRRPISDPRTVVGTAGADWTPSERFDASLLVRRAGAAGAETQLSTDTGDSASLRVRARDPEAGWHGSIFGRLKERSEDGADARVRANAYGFAVGGHGDAGWWELTGTRHDFTVASDTAFVVNLAIDPTRSPQRVRYEESVDALTFSFSREISGPLRGFGALSWNRATGDLPSRWRDASLGLGWRLAPGTELKAEVRGVAYHERERSVDDYDAKMVTVSVVYEF